MNTEFINGWKVKNLHDFCSNGSLIKEALSQIQVPIANKTIYIQDEHTLVLPGGRDMRPNAPISSIKSSTNLNYLVRLNNEKECMEADYIIDYAIPNIINLKNCQYYKHLKGKLLYAPAIPNKLDVINKKRQLDIITTFNDTRQQRRAFLIEQLIRNNLPYKNIRGIFGENQNSKLYAKSKILINIHQTDHHHTIEEFRILPAIAAGCIVIAEHSPLEKYLPYHPFVYWAKYNEIPEVAAYILNNYKHMICKLNIDNNLIEYLNWYRAKALHRLLAKLR